MIEWFKTWSAKRKQKNHYEQSLWQNIQELKFSESDKTRLEQIGNGLNPAVIRKLNIAATKRLLAQFTNDRKLTAEEHNQLNGVANFTGISPTKEGLVDADNLAMMRLRGLVSEGKLVPIGNESAPVIMKSGETLTFLATARMMKMKRITQRVGYSGFSTSIKICKGVRYRVGSYKPVVHTSEHLVTDDVGLFWVSDRRIGFKGEKNWSLEVGKVAGFEINADGLLEVFKDGKEKPYLINSSEIDTIASIISLLVNEEYELLESNLVAG